MNFQSLKWMMDSIINSYKCPECTNQINESNIDIMWAAWTTINIDIECFNCGKHSMMKTEILAIDLSKNWISAENFEKLKETIWAIKPQLKQNIVKINDAEIVWLNKDLNQNWLNVSDLLWWK